jgi:uncharacterized protein
MASFEIFRDHAGEYRWRLRADNGEPIATGEGHSSPGDAARAADTVKRVAPTATIEDEVLG